MKKKKSGNIEWVEFENFRNIPDLFHGVFLRHGGWSTGPYASLNTAANVGDEKSSVEKNLDAIRNIAGVIKLVSGRQCHGTFIANINSLSPQEIPDCDGLITSQKNIGLLIKHADCQAAIFVDPLKRVIANVHAGWKGCVQNIYKKTIQQLQSKWGCRPENLLVGISPSLGPEASEFINYKNEFPQELWQFQWKPNYFNLWELARTELLSCGILPHHLEIASVCTYAHPEDFFSYRRDKITGRHGTVVAFITS